jgi:hypothetical protein
LHTAILPEGTRFGVLSSSTHRSLQCFMWAIPCPELAVRTRNAYSGSMPLPFPLPTGPLSYALVAGVSLLIAALLWMKNRRPWLARIKRKPLLTANEAEFFRRLQRALPAYAVFPQVSFAALLTDDGQLTAKARWSVRARFDRKIADYVICDRRTLQVIAIVELDDRMHDTHADRQRDAITRAASYQTIRFQSRQKPTETEIAALFQHARAWV